MAATIIADLATLSYFQIELSLKIAAAYGHDLTDLETRAREILHLHGLGDDRMEGKPSPRRREGGERAGKRLLIRYLRGDALKAAKSLFRFAGIKFTRTWLVKMLPFVNVPVGAVIADVTTRRSASNARKFYAMLPPPAVADCPRSRVSAPTRFRHGLRAVWLSLTLRHVVTRTSRAARVLRSELARLDSCPLYVRLPRSWL